MSFKYKLKKYRKLRGMTQKELGLAIGISEISAESTISQYERGAKKPKNRITHIKLAQALDVPIRSLNDNDPTEPFYGFNYLMVLSVINDFKINTEDNKIVLDIPETSPMYQQMQDYKKAKQMLEDGDMTQKDFEYWMLSYPLAYPSFDYDLQKEEFKKYFDYDLTPEIYKPDTKDYDQLLVKMTGKMTKDFVKGLFKKKK